MGRTKFGSPTLELEIGPEQYAEAVESSSGSCLIADAIARQYPHLSRVSVDMATVRATDRKLGLRYTYLTPTTAQMLLLGFDQGWPQSTESVRIMRAVKVQPVVVEPRRAAARAERRAELEAKVAAGDELTQPEKASLKRLRTSPARPTKRGRSQVKAGAGHRVVHGGTPIPQGPAHPNLLRGRDRHYGAKVSKPGTAWENAVAEAVAERVASGELVLAEPELEAGGTNG